MSIRNQIVAVIGKSKPQKVNPYVRPTELS